MVDSSAHRFCFEMICHTLQICRAASLRTRDRVKVYETSMGIATSHSLVNVMSDTRKIFVSNIRPFQI